MRKLSIILVLLGVLVALSGCLQQDVEEAAIMGTDGLVISFESGMPPTSIYIDEEFDIGILVENKGAAKIPAQDAAVFIKGILYNSYSGIDSATAKKPVTSILEGAYVDETRTISGDSDVLSWTGLKYTVPLTVGGDTVKFEAQSCYKYSTNSRSKMCLEAGSAVRDTMGAAICEVSGDKPVTNDAAPVHVSKVTEESKRDGFRAVIEIQNVGNGEVYDSAMGTNCLENTILRKHQGIVYIDEVKLGTQALTDCNWRSTTDRPASHVVLRDGVAALACSVDLSGQLIGISEENLNIKLSYGYSETTQKSMDIDVIV